MHQRLDLNKIAIVPAFDVTSGRVIGWLWHIMYGRRQVGLLKRVRGGGLIQFLKYPPPEAEVAIVDAVRTHAEANLGMTIAAGDVVKPPHPDKLRQMHQATKKSRRKQEPKRRIITPDDPEW